MIDRDVAPFHFGSSGRALFGWYHPARNESHRNTGVVLCNPIGDDYVRAHRTLRHIAEQLAGAGFSVLRFDFSGTGDSVSEEHDPGQVKAWLGDIDLAVDELRARSGVDKIALAGLRLGATLAIAAAARRQDIESLILWSPYLSGRAYVSDKTKLHKMYAFLEPESFAIEPNELDLGGKQALGFFMSNATIDELNLLAPLEIDTCPARNILVIDGGNSSNYEPLLKRLRETGATPEYLQLTDRNFLVTIPHKSSVPKEVVGEITAWLSFRHEASQALDKKFTAQAKPEIPDLLEEPMFFGERDSLFGILTSPREELRSKTRPIIILVNAGTVHRVGPHRLYVRMAREWADLGFHVFRMDVSGIGDSPAVPGSVENLCYPPDPVGNVQAAMKQLGGKLSVNRFIVAGLCSGGDVAFQTGLNDGRVVGTVVMNPRTFCMLDLESVETQAERSAVHATLMKKDKWLKLLQGKVDVSGIVRKLIATIPSKAPKKKPSENLVLEKTVPACFRTMAERGVDTYLVVTERDPGIHYVDLHFGKAMSTLERVKGFRRTDIKGTDHTFTSLYAQKVVLGHVSDHLVKNHSHSIV